MDNELDLINGEFQHSNLFVHLPVFDHIYYLGHLEGKVRKYKAIREDQPCIFLSLNFIRKDEDVLWDAVEDFLKRSIQTCSLAVHGVYTFDLLTIDIHKEVHNFNHNEFATVLINHARKLMPGQKRLVKYSSAYGILQKLVHEDWGKMTLKTSVDVFKDKSTFLDLLVKQLISNFDFSNDPGILLLNDLSANPVFDPKDEEQQKRLNQVILAQIPKAIDFPPEVYIQDKNCVKELLSGQIVK